MARQFTHEERERLSQLRAAGETQASIARILGRSPSSISRELRRNGQGESYFALHAQRQAEARRRERPRQPKMERRDISDFVRAGLTSYWSPEQIAGRLQLEFPNDRQRHISHQTIYTWIDREPYRKHWEQFLRQRGRKRSEPEKRGQLVNRIAVGDRPEVVNQRRRYGDWEGDTIVGRQRQSALVSLVERKSRFTLLHRVSDLKAQTVRAAVRDSLQPLPDDLRKTATFDNGKEFAQHEQLAEELGLDIYFAEPYAAWQRGTNENTNGLVRQFYPKGTDFTKVRPSALLETQDLLNERPRKCLGYRTPAEILEKRGVALEA